KRGNTCSHDCPALAKSRLERGTQVRFSCTYCAWPGHPAYSTHRLYTRCETVIWRTGTTAWLRTTPARCLSDKPNLWKPRTSRRLPASMDMVWMPRVDRIWYAA